MTTSQGVSARVPMGLRQFFRRVTGKTVSRKGMYGQSFGGPAMRSYMVMPGQAVWMDRDYAQFSQEAYINDARANIAYMIRNGEDWGDANGIDRPITAADSIGNTIPKAEMRTYLDSQDAATKADATIAQGGKDPTNGAIYMSIVSDNSTILNGKTLTVSTGPFHNSFPNKDVPAKTVYINFSK